MEEQLIKLTDYVIRELFHKNISNAAALFHPEILYEEGSKEHQLRGSTRVSQELEKSPALESEIAEGNFGIAVSGKDMKVITGDYLQCVEIGKEKIYKRKQHIIAVWRRGKENWSICYIYLPGTIMRRKEEITFSQEISRELCEKVLESVHLQSEQERKLIVSGKNGAHYLIREKYIRYIEAQGRYSKIYCVNQEVDTPEGMGKIEKRLGDNFLKIHRSYIVNLSYVEQITRFWLIMDRKEELPIPAERYAQIKQILTNLK